jgi:crossover junction endodeoxyribonuclease RusA
VNHYWRNVGPGRTVVSREGRSYRHECAWTAIQQQQTRRPTLRGPLYMLILAHLPDRRMRDIDNYFKAPLDALKSAGVYLDDSQIKQLCISLLPGVKKPGLLEVTMEELPAYPGYVEPKPRTADAGRRRSPRRRPGPIR